MPQSLLKYLALFLILFAGIASDQYSKQWAATNLKNRPVRVCIKNALELGYTENRGMVFGINNRGNNAFSRNALLLVRILLSIGLSIFLFFNRRKGLLFHLPFLLILAGAIGNVIDSLRFGHVVDFIHMHLGNILDWPFLYNLADAYVCIGMGILILQSLIGEKKKAPKPLPPPLPGSDS
ncbi:MAG: signal peptidase II [Chitinispirillaceae bacterium]|nr:signal peptidase II [Chitinispirillaceae bacterium]